MNAQTQTHVRRRSVTDADTWTKAKTQGRQTRKGLVTCLPLGQQHFEAVKESPQYCRKVSWTKMAQNGQNDHFGQNGLIPNWILVLARPRWTKMVHLGPSWAKEVYFGPFRSANRTLASPELWAK